VKLVSKMIGPPREYSVFNVALEGLVRGGEAAIAFCSVAFPFMYWLYTIAAEDERLCAMVGTSGKVTPCKPKTSFNFSDRLEQDIPGKFVRVIMRS